jgi:signal transduction histidine kinase
MNAILGFSELLWTQLAASKERQYLEAVSSSGRTLSALINDILDLSKIEAGKPRFQYEPVSVARIVEELTRLFSIKAAEKGVGAVDYVTKLFNGAELLARVRTHLAPGRSSVRRVPGVAALQLPGAVQ